LQNDLMMMIRLVQQRMLKIFYFDSN